MNIIKFIETSVRIVEEKENVEISITMKKGDENNRTLSTPKERIS